MTTSAVRVAAFPSAAELVLDIAMSQGFFAREGLDVEAHKVSGSREQFAGLQVGHWDILHTAADNVLVQRSQGRNIVVVYGVSRGLLTLVAGADVRSPSDLRGNRVGVDSAHSGYAAVLRHVLRLLDLPHDAYTVVEVGGTRERAAALARGDIAATLLTPPYDVRAVHRDGARVLARPSTHLPAYLGSTVAVDRSWAVQHEPSLTNYLRALTAASTWTCDPANRERVTHLLSLDIGEPVEIASRVLERVLDRETGLLRDGYVNVADISAVLQVRNQDGEPMALAPEACLDMTYLKRAGRPRQDGTPAQ